MSFDLMQWAADHDLDLALAVGTGGGCTAHMLYARDGSERYLMLTDVDGGIIPLPGGPIAVGLYSRDGDTVGEVEFVHADRAHLDLGPTMEELLGL